MAKLQNTERKHFSWGSFFPEVRNSGLQTYIVREKDQFCKYFSGIFESLEYLVLSDLFKKSICSGVFSSAVRCRICSISCIVKELYYIIFSEYFPKFSV